MYESPIDLYISDIHNQIVAQQDEQIYQAVVHFFPDVKRDELLKALQYDREQYDKGYADGKRDAMDELVRCKDCIHCEACEGGKDFCCFHATGIVPDDFCSYGKKKEAEG
jgi:hypothetical protein